MAVMKLLVIDDEDIDRQLIRRLLKRANFACEVSEAAEAFEGLRLAIDQRFDCILLDHHLPDRNGLDLVRELRELHKITTPLIVLTGEGNEMVAVQAMKRGASDYLPKAMLTPDALARAIGDSVDRHFLQLQYLQARRELEQQALFDPLTKLGNRTLFDRQIERAIASASRRRSPFPLLIMGLDHLSPIVEHHGPQAADTVLAEVGRRLLTGARGEDTYFRLGADSFAAILETEVPGGAAAVSRRVEVELGRPIPIGDVSVTVGVSIGAAHFPADGQDTKALLRFADQEMYAVRRAKELTR
jgi:diguanylate cyclase (GGDEF)-like protein